MAGAHPNHFEAKRTELADYIHWQAGKNAQHQTDPDSKFPDLEEQLSMAATKLQQNWTTPSQL